MISQFITRSLTRGLQHSYRTYYVPAITASYILQQRQNIYNKHSVTVVRHPFVYPIRTCSRSDHVTANIENVCYEVIKDLTNNPEFLLIDVREPDELRQTGQIPTSINIPLSRVQSELGNETKPEDFKNKYSRDKPCPNSTIIFHCRSGVRSLEAGKCAVDMGYTNVKNYKGSWNDWAQHEGLPTY